MYEKVKRNNSHSKNKIEEADSAHLHTASRASKDEGNMFLRNVG
jgi:hypothetical protein